MTVLALETVTRAGSVALWRDGRAAVRAGDASRTHGERLPGEVLDFLAAHGAALGDVDLIAVASGPGSFTGLRIGLAAVQGLAIAHRRAVLGVPTLEALAAGFALTTTQRAVVVACLDGQRGDVFLAAWRVDRPGEFDASAVVVEPLVGTPESAGAAVREAIAGHAVSPVVALGSGAERYRDRFAALLPDAQIVDEPMTIAEAVARLAAARRDAATSPHALRPIYLRRPDAELARERARASAPAGAAGREAIRPATGAADLADVEALQRRTFTNPWGAEAIKWELENTDVARLYVSRDGEGTLVGYCACWMIFDELHINSLAVAPERRRQGIARRLLQAVFREAVAAGARSATLEVRHSNRPAIALYEGLGFHGEGVRRDYYQDPREDALILWNRHLTST